MPVSRSTRHSDFAFTNVTRDYRRPARIATIGRSGRSAGICRATAGPSPSTARGGGRGSHAIESTGRIFMRKTLWLGAVAALALVAQSGADGAAAQTRTTLDIYVVDVEGGNATLL